jgi:release factor glutamine methyltransferase
MEELYNKIRLQFERNLSILEDKPEETIESTIKALWYKAQGKAISAEKATNLPLVDLSDHQKKILNQLVEKRLNGEPLAHITGRQSFMGIELLSDRRALIPRKETEILGKNALSLCRKIAENKPVVNVFDVCCGSGNLGLAIACHHHNTLIHSSDLSHEAVELTNENISFLGLNNQVKVLQSDLFLNFDSADYWNKIDLIICNPPYISTSKVSRMTSEISENEPAMAFDGGMVGLKIIQKLIQESPKFLSENGWLIFEVGLGQGPFVIQLCEKSGLYQQVKSVTDESGNIRVIAACYNQDINLETA